VKALFRIFEVLGPNSFYWRWKANERPPLPAGVSAKQRNVCSRNGTAHLDLRQAWRVLSSASPGLGLSLVNNQFSNPASRSAQMPAAFLMLITNVTRELPKSFGGQLGGFTGCE
jgi:hypothetical protein